MAEDQEKSVDELINDALEAYAQLAGYQTGIDLIRIRTRDDDGPSTPPPSTATDGTATRRGRTGHAAPPPPPPLPRGDALRAADPGAQGGLGGMFQAGAATPPPPRRRTPASRTARPGCRRRRCTWCSTTRIPHRQGPVHHRPRRKSSDLPIKDGNISRKHAAVIRRNGTYFIKDLGSTNGIDFKGMRIDNKRIDEGDVFHLCDYELRFTYKR